MMISELLEPLNGGKSPVDPLHGWAMSLVSPGEQPAVQIELVDLHIV